MRNVILDLSEKQRCQPVSPSTVLRVAEARLPTEFGDFQIIGYRSLISPEEFVALVRGVSCPGRASLVRIHSQCMTGDVFGSIRCDCGRQFREANYIRLVGDRRRRMEKKLSDIMSKDVSARVCELLHELSSNSSGSAATAREYLVPLTHYDVASLIGASRQTTTSVLNELERGGIIDLGRGWIRVKRLKELRSRAGLIIAAGLQVFSSLCQLADISLM